jgi:hypothetical protein
MNFFGDAGAANNLATLQHQRFESCSGEIAGSDKPVVAGTDDDDVVGWHKNQPQMDADKRGSEQTRSAELEMVFQICFYPR